MVEQKVAPRVATRAGLRAVMSVAVMAGCSAAKKVVPRAARRAER